MRTGAKCRIRVRMKAKLYPAWMGGRCEVPPAVTNMPRFPGPGTRNSSTPEKKQEILAKLYRLLFGSVINVKDPVPYPWWLRKTWAQIRDCDPIGSFQDGDLRKHIRARKGQKYNRSDTQRYLLRNERDLQAFLTGDVKYGNVILHVKHPNEICTCYLPVLKVSVADPWHSGVDPDPDLDPRIHASD